MEYLIITSDGSYKLYHSLSRLCKDNGIDGGQFTKKDLPVKSSKGVIIGLVPDTRI
jgi:hypothetical protein